MILPAETDGLPGGRTIFNRGGRKCRYLRQVPTQVACDDAAEHEHASPTYSQLSSIRTPLFWAKG